MSRKYVEKTEVEIRRRAIQSIEDFLNRNKDYTIEIYIKDANNGGFCVEENYVPTGRNWNFDDEKKLKIIWHSGCYSVSIPTDKISGYYEGIDKNGQENVQVILESGICVEFECIKKNETYAKKTNKEITITV